MTLLRHAERACATYGIDVREILAELRRRRSGRQEDMIVDVGLELVRQRGRDA